MVKPRTITGKYRLSIVLLSSKKELITHKKSDTENLYRYRFRSPLFTYSLIMSSREVGGAGLTSWGLIYVITPIQAAKIM